MVQTVDSNSSLSWLPAAFTGDNIIKTADSSWKVVKKFLKGLPQNNLEWLRDASGVKTLLVKFPDAIVSISNRIGPATHIPGKMINIFADTMMPLQKLGGYTLPVLCLAEVLSEFKAMFSPYKERVEYVVKDAGGNAYQAQFSLGPWEQKFFKALNIADWTMQFNGFAGYIWGLNHTADEKFPLASFVPWIGRYMSAEVLYYEGRFLYETLWVGEPQKYDEVKKTYVPIESNATVAGEEIVRSLLWISLCVTCVGLDIFKAVAAKGNQSPWLDTAIFCAGLAPTFIKPFAIRYWPKMVVRPLYAAAASA